jgi:hypothetical protein
MTTITFKAGILAADTLISYSNITNGNRNKIARCGKHTVALAGNTYLRRPLEEWVADGCNPASVPQALLDDDAVFAALIIDQDGNVFEFDNGYLTPVYADYTAIGSGAMLALGAMAHGASAVEAVIAAALHDKNSGGPVTSLSFPLES